jgi:hypothetical protein
VEIVNAIIKKRRKGKGGLMRKQQEPIGAKLKRWGVVNGVIFLLICREVW